MEEIKFTRDDRTFLRDMHIDPQATIAEDMIDVITAPTQYEPTNFIVSHRTAQAVIKEFGELTWKNYWAYVSKFGNG